jgi:predicted phage terminase large subunit-like protein
MDPNQQKELIKIAKKGHDDLYYLCREILGYDRMVPTPHQDLSDFLRDSKKRTKLILMPRGSFKSSVVTVGYSIQQLIQDPKKTILISGETQANAIKFVGEMKNHLEVNPKFRGLYGDWVNRGNTWKANEFVIKPRQGLFGGKEASVTAGSLEKGTQVGMHYDTIILDDVVSRNNINSEDQISKTIEHYKLLLSILNPDGMIIVVGTMWGHGTLYSWLMDPEGPEYDQVETFHRAAEDDNGNLLMPEVLSRNFLDQMRKTQGEFIYACNPGDAPILMSDFTTKRLDEIEVGDEVIGFDTSGREAKIVKSKVEEINSRMADTNRYILNSGHEIRCTPDHKWYRGKSTDKEMYAPLGQKSPLKQVVDLHYHPTEKALLDWNYLAGMIDGEGACRYGSISISQCVKHNPDVCRKIEETIKNLEIDFKIYCREGVENQRIYTLNGGRDLKCKLLRYGNPGKKLQILKTIWDKPGRLAIPNTRHKAKVAKIIPYKKERVYALKTSTGNYVAWGYASKNCQYLNKLTSSDVNIFKEKDIRFYDKNPYGLIYFITLDPAISVKAKSDYSAIIVNGVDHKGDWYIQEAIQDRLEPSDLIQLLFELFQRYNPIMCLGMEKFVIEKLLQKSLYEEMEKRNIFIPIKELPTNTKVSKEVRIKALQPMVEQHRVYLKKEHTELLRQMLYFPAVRYDDLLDALKSQLQVVFPSDKIPPNEVKGPKMSFNEVRVWDDLKKYDRPRRVHDTYGDI